jgi:hypothetical protein
MTPVASVDFETYYDNECSVKTLGVHGYCNHPDFIAYLVAITSTTGVRYVGEPKDAPWEAIKDCLWVSHNAGFDRYVYKTITGKDHENWQCTANLSRYLRAGGSLAKAAKNLLGVILSKDVRNSMKGLLPAKMRVMPSSIPKEFPSFYDEVCAYALNDSEVCLRLWTECSDKWPSFEKDLSLLTLKQCIRGFPIDLPKIQESLEILGKASLEATNRLPWVKNGEKPLSRKSFFRACHEAGIEVPKSLAKDDEDFQAWNEKYSGQFQWAADRRTINQAAIFSSRLERMQANAFNLCGDRMAYSMLYFGAHTGRWSGSDGFNIHNLNRDTACGVNLRACIAVKAPKKLIISDLAQIEARITPYLAGDDKLIDIICQGYSVYEAHARATMGWVGGELKTEDPKQYRLAKVRVLALGFGCGWNRFKAVAKTMLGLDLSDSEAKAVVGDYRKQNPKIVGLWDTLGDGLKQAARKRQNYTVELPSGRSLVYLSPTLHKDIEFNKEGIKVKLEPDAPETWVHGPLLAENLIQATARDVFAESLLRLEASGKYPVLFHVHDEAVVEADQSGDPKEVEAIMSVTPEWLKGCPIGAEAQESQYYLK